MTAKEARYLRKQLSKHQTLDSNSPRDDEENKALDPKNFTINMNDSPQKSTQTEQSPLNSKDFKIGETMLSKEYRDKLKELNEANSEVDISNSANKSAQRYRSQ